MKAMLALILMSVSTLAAQTRPLKVSAKTPEIILIGSIHNLHFEERYHYSLIDLQAQVKAMHPDVVCGEITPEAYNQPMEGNFPPEAAMLAEMAPLWGARFIPADWRISFAWQHRAEQQESENKVKLAEVTNAQNMQKAIFDKFLGVSLYDSLTSADELAGVDRMFEQVIGENTPSDIAAGAWHERNRRIIENCLAEAGTAKRIVFVFGGTHLPQLQRQLVARGLIGHIPPREFAPAGFGIMPPAIIARWQRNLKNLKGIADGSIDVSSDMRAKVNDTNRAPVLSTEIDLYVERQKIQQQ